MSNEAFWGLTLRRFALLGERHKAREKLEDLRAGVEWKEEAAVQTEEQMLENMQLWTKTTSALPS